MRYSPPRAQRVASGGDLVEIGGATRWAMTGNAGFWHGGPSGPPSNTRARGKRPVLEEGSNRGNAAAGALRGPWGQREVLFCRSQHWQALYDRLVARRASPSLWQVCWASPL